MKSFKEYLTKSIFEVYHGSKQVINDFKYEYTNSGNDQLGSGFYFTSDPEDAKIYGDKIHKVQLTLKNPIDADKKGSMDINQVLMFINNSPDIEDSLSNWGDVDRYSIQKIAREAAINYTFKNENIVRSLFNLANDFYPNDVEKFNRMITKVLKYDGIIKRHDNGVIHYVAFFPEQIKVIGREEI